MNEDDIDKMLKEMIEEDVQEKLGGYSLDDVRKELMREDLAFKDIIILTKAKEKEVFEVLKAENDKDENTLSRKIQKLLDRENFSDEDKFFKKFSSGLSQLQPFVEVKSFLNSNDWRYEEKYKDMKADVKRILSSEDLSLGMVYYCFRRLSPNATVNAIISNPKLKAKVKDLFKDHKTLFLQREINQYMKRFGISDFEPLVKATEERLKQQPGAEVFAVMDTSLYDLEEVKALSVLREVQDQYYDQTETLTGYPATCYLYYHDEGHDSYWNNDEGARLKILDYLGTYRDNPPLEDVLEEKIGRIFAYYSYHELYTDKKLNSISEVAANRFEKRLYEALEKDIDSPESKFYLKHAPKVFRYDRVGDKYVKLAMYMLDNYQETRPELCEEVFDGLKEVSYYRDDCREASQRVREELRHDPASDKAKLYWQYFSKMFDYEEYAEMVNKTVKEHKEDNPQLCDMICKGFAKTGKEEDVKKLYLEFPNADLADRMAEDVKNYSHSIPELYEYFARTGLKCFEDKMREKLAEKNTLRIVNLKKDMDYQPLFDMLKTMPNIITVEIGESMSKKQLHGLFDGNDNITCAKFGNAVKTIDADVFTKARNLEKIDSVNVDGFVLTSPEKIIQHLPAIRVIGHSKFNKDGAEKLFKALMVHKPASLEAIPQSELTDKQAEQLMRKYPDLVVGYYSGNEMLRTLQSRNKDVINAKTLHKPLRHIIDSKILNEFLVSVPADKRPTYEDFSQPMTEQSGEKFDSYFDFMRKKYGRRFEPELLKTAQLLKFTEAEKELKLLEAAKNHKAAKYIESLPPEERPTLKQLSEPMQYSLCKESFWKRLEDCYNDDEKGENECINEMKKVLQVLNVSDEELKEADPQSRLVSAAGMLLEQRRLKQEMQAGKDDFMAWMAANNNKNIKE